ncbi:MAG: glycosyltransferase family 4 protein [Chlamydiota bacterium]
MRILHLEASPGWGGQEIRILREAEGMRKRGHEVIFAVMRDGGLISRARNAGFTVYELNFKRSAWIYCLFALVRIMRRHKIDLVNTHSSLDGWIGGIAARLGGKSVVRTRHLSTPIKPGWNSRLLYGRLADFVVTTCSSIIPMISSQSGKTLTQCRSIPTGVDPEGICFEKKDALAFRESIQVAVDDFLVGTACFMRSWKGIDDFLKSADLLRSTPKLKWVIIGGGHAETYHKKARALKLENIVYFTGHLDNPFPALGSLDLFALLSTAHEGVSQAILQAAYLKVPLISTTTGGLGEVCLDRITGLQVAPFSPDEVARAVLELKEDGALRKELGQRGFQLVQGQFTLTHTIDGMEEVYKKVLFEKKR